MKSVRVYLPLLIFCAGILALGTSGCARKSGCATIATTQTKLKKDGTPRKKARTNLFDKRTNRRAKRN